MSAGKQIYFPDEIDEFSRSAWQQQASDAGYEVVPKLVESIVFGSMEELLILISASSPSASSALFDRVNQFLNKFKKNGKPMNITTMPGNVRLVSSSIFHLSVGPTFPDSIETFRTLFQSFRLCPTGVQASEKNAMTVCATAMGGVVEGEYNGTTTTHLVVAQVLSAATASSPAKPSMSKKYSAARKVARNNPKLQQKIVTPGWIQACFQQGKVLPCEDFEVLHLSGYIIACYGLSADEEKLVEQRVTENGGVVVPLLTYRGKSSISHILTHSELPADVTAQLSNVKQINVVKLEWLDTLLSSNAEKHDETPFYFRSPEEEAAYQVRVKAEQAKQEAIRKAAEEKLKLAEQQRAQEEATRKEEEAARKHKDERIRLENEAAAEAARRVAEQAEAEAEAARQASAAAEALRLQYMVDYDSDNDMWLSSIQVILICLDSPDQLRFLIDIVRSGGGVRHMHMHGRENPAELAKHVPNVNCTNTFVVYGSCSREVLDDKIKSQYGKSKGLASITVPIVNYQWLVACYKAKAVVPYKPFELPPASTQDSSATFSTITVAPLSARGPSPAPPLVRTPSLSRAAKAEALARPVASLMRSNSSKNMQQQQQVNDSGMDLDVTLDVTANRSIDVKSPAIEGAANFGDFNRSLNEQSKSGSLARANSQHARLPPTGATTPTATSSILQKIAGSSNLTNVIFRGQNFYVEEEETEGERKEKEEELLSALRFSDKDRITARKELKDFGGSVFGEIRKDAIDVVIGGVCGSQFQKRSVFEKVYGAKARFASYMWVSACVKANRLLPIHAVDDVATNHCWTGQIPRVNTSFKPVLALQSLYMSSTGFNAPETNVIQALVEATGARFNGKFQSSSHTHLISFDSASKENELKKSYSTARSTTPPNVSTDLGISKKKEAAFRAQIPVVHLQWLIDCVAKRKYADEKPFLIVPTKELMTAIKQSGTSHSGRASRNANESVAVPVSPAISVATPIVNFPAVELGHAAVAVAKPEAVSPAITAVVPPKTGVADSKEGEIDSDFDDDDDFGFHKGIQNALQAQPIVVPSPTVRSKRTKKTNVDVAAAAAAAAAPSPHITSGSVSVQSISSDDSSVRPSNAKAAFQHLRKGKKVDAKVNKTSVSMVAEEDENDAAMDDSDVKAGVGALDMDEDEGEAEYVAPMKQNKPSAEDAIMISDNESTTSSLQLRPFQKKKHSSDVIAIQHVSLANASKVVPPVLLNDAAEAPPSSGKKKFTKVHPSKQSTAMKSSFEALSSPTEKSAKDPATPSASAESETSVPRKSEATPGMRIRRRIHVSQDEEESAAEPTTEAIPEENVAEDEQPGAVGEAGSHAVPESIAEESAVIEPTKPKRGRAGRKSQAIEENEEEESKAIEASHIAVAPSDESKATKRGRGKKESSQLIAVDEPSAKQDIAATPSGRSSRRSQAAALATPESAAALSNSAASTPQPSTRASRSTKAKESTQSLEQVTEKAEQELEQEQTMENNEKEEVKREEDTTDTAAADLKSSKSTSKSAKVTTNASETSSPSKSSPLRASRLTTPARESVRSRYAAASANKPGAVTRSPSLGGFVEPRLDDPKPRSARSAKPKTYNILKIDPASQHDDPFATPSQQMREQNGAVEETNPKSKADDGSAQTTQILDGAVVDSSEPVHSPPATRKKREAAEVVSAKVEGEQPVQPEAAPTKGAKKKKNLVEVGRKKGKSDEATSDVAVAAETAPSSPVKKKSIVEVTEFSLTPSLSQMNDHEFVPAAAPRSARKRKNDLESTIAYSQAAVKPEDEVPAAEQPIKKKQKVSKKKNEAGEAEPTLVAAAPLALAEDMEDDANSAAVAPVKGKKKSNTAMSSQPTSSPPLLKGNSKASQKETKDSKKRKEQAESTAGAAVEESAEEEVVASPPKTKKAKAAPSSGSKVASGSAQAHCFSFSGIPSSEKAKYGAIVKKLGGTLLSDDPIDYNKVTHIITGADLKRSEKVYVSLIGQQYLLHISYLDDSNEAGQFLDEREYEWNHINSKNADPGLLAPALNHWYRGRVQPYLSWRVAVFEEEGNPRNWRRVARALIEVGGGEIVSADDEHVTHMLVGCAATTQSGLKKESPVLAEHVQQCLAHQSNSSAVNVVRADYLTQHLIDCGEAAIKDFQITFRGVNGSIVKGKDAIAGSANGAGSISNTPPARKASASQKTAASRQPSTAAAAEVPPAVEAPPSKKSKTASQSTEDIEMKTETTDFEVPLDRSVRKTVRRMKKD